MSTSIMKRSVVEPPAGTSPDVDTARQVHDVLRRMIARAMSPSRGRRTTDLLRELAVGVIRQAESDGVVLSEDDYIELIEALAKTEMAIHVSSWIGSWVSEMIDPPEPSLHWSGGMAMMRHYTLMEREHG